MQTAVKGISVKELTKKVLNGEQLFILDVRNTGDFDDQKIEGKNVMIINQPYFDLMEGSDPIMDKLRKGEPIYVICAKGGSSQFVAEQIAEAGYDNVYSIEGGMKAWSEHLEPIKIGELKSGGTLYQFARIGKGCLSYLIESNGEGAMIDTNRMLEQYEEFINQHNIKIKYVIDTHLHADHISGGRKIAEMTNATYWLPPKDAREVTFDYQPLEEGNDVTIGHTKINIHPLYSPGHTIGSTSFVIDETFLLSGDILFIDSIGKPDLAGMAEDWVSDLREILYKRYRELSDELIVLPAHL